MAIANENNNNIAASVAVATIAKATLLIEMAPDENGM